MKLPQCWSGSQQQSMSHGSRATPAAADVVQQINGNYGRWQLRSIFLIFLCKIPAAWFMACIIYAAPTPHKEQLICHPAGNDSLLLEDERSTDRHFRLQICHTYVQQYGPALSCAHMQQNGAYASLLTQYDLLCSRRMLVALTQSAYALGALVGGLLAHKILQHISPRRLLLLGMLGQLCCGNLTGLLDTYQLHICFRCLTSLCCALMYTAGQLILNDITAGQARLIILTLSELCWSIGLVLLPAISIYFDSWSHLYVAISSTLFALLWLHRWIADAPRWLLQHQRMEPALRLLLESASQNNHRVPLTLDVQLTVYAAQLAEEKQPSYCRLWNGDTKRSQLLYMHCIWGCALVSYDSMLLMIRQLDTAQLHVNTAAFGFAEITGIFVGLYFMLYTRRHWRWTGNLMIAAALSAYLVWLLPESIRSSRHAGTLELCFWLLLKFANAASIAVLSSCTGELVSLEKRMLLMLSVVSCSRCCLLFSPLLSTLSVVHRLLPITIIATLGWLYGLALRRLNRYYWNNEESLRSQVPTPNMYRRSSVTLLRRRSSTSSSELNFGQPSSSFEQSLAVSISDIWHISFHNIHQCDSAAQIEEREIKRNRFAVM